MKNLLKFVTNYTLVTIEQGNEIKISKTKLICGRWTQNRLGFLTNKNSEN